MIFDKLFNKKEPERETLPLDRDAEGRPLYKENIEAYITKELERRRDERRPFELQWTLNSNFLAGNQNCDINVHSGEIEQVEPMYDWYASNSYNRIAPLMETRNANIKSVTYGMRVLPRTSELDDYAKADIATKLLSYAMYAGEFERKRNTLISWMELCGTAAMLSYWDPRAGEKVGIAVDENGENDIMTGDLKYGLLSPYEIFPESPYKEDSDDQRSVITAQVMTKEDVYDIFGVEADGKSVDTYCLMPVPSSGGMGAEYTVQGVTMRSVDDAVEVITYYEKPGRRYPKGRMAILINGKLHHYGELPYDEIPIVVFRSKRVPGQYFGKSIIQDLIPLQRAYNAVKNKIHDYIATIACNPLLVPDGSVDVDELSDNGVPPGKVIPYSSSRGKPDFLDYPTLPEQVSREAAQLANDMEYIAGVSQLMVVGAAPSGVTSGTAIDNLRQIDSTRMSVVGENLRYAVMDCAKLWLGIYKRYASGYRVVCIAGTENSGSALTWCSDDINSFDIEFTSDNELENSREAQKQAFIEAYNMGLFTDDTGRVPRDIRRKLLEYMHIGDYSDAMSIDEMQRKNARRENAYYDHGVIPKIGLYDDDAIHVEEHTRFALELRYKIASNRSPEYAKAFDNHILEHKKRIQESKNAAIAAAQQLQGGSNE